MENLPSPEVVYVMINLGPDEPIAIMQFVSRTPIAKYPAGYFRNKKNQPLSFSTVREKDKIDIDDDGILWENRTASNENIKAEIVKTFGTFYPFRIGTVDEIPTDRLFRQAWRDGGSFIETNMSAARDITRRQIRDARKALLADLDIQGIRAIEDADTDAQNRVKTEKQRLRDLPAHPDIEAAETPEQLKALML